MPSSFKSLCNVALDTWSNWYLKIRAVHDIRFVPRHSYIATDVARNTDYISTVGARIPPQLHYKFLASSFGCLWLDGGVFWNGYFSAIIKSNLLHRTVHDFCCIIKFILFCVKESSPCSPALYRCRSHAGDPVTIVRILWVHVHVYTVSINM